MCRLPLGTYDDSTFYSAVASSLLTFFSSPGLFRVVAPPGGYTLLLLPARVGHFWAVRVFRVWTVDALFLCSWKAVVLDFGIIQLFC